MSETRATAPVFPPGRYGRRRDGRRRLLVPVIFAVVVAVTAATLAVRLYQQYGNPHYDAQIVRWTGATETQITIDFTVRVPAGGAAACDLRARDYAGNQVGIRTVTVRAAAGGSTIEASEVVPTTAKAFVGEVLRCRAAA
ncbi:DUF4307 domain-containing protein [Couchioplanes caeruleus]|uniref:DUF4307 domain-containing protein n=2 Tax=Couchioplanes caeruleus TaxID=56438 RepID=A0A1K0FPE6_9ACTN|nr:DUF4307 domain-containing protein [Couchioplanes caeruleus]OJF14665.1 hypothetical protein BG844_08470 [Couchioplanes caeruleus subsp. caeruleus]ROP30060.1 uncharacterized protein DUF4307 [Couchioplanes caeruleus]